MHLPSKQCTHLLYNRLQFQPSNHSRVWRQVSIQERQKKGDAEEGTGVKDVADAAQDAGADEMTIRHLSPTNSDKDAEVAGY